MNKEELEKYRDAASDAFYAASGVTASYDVAYDAAYYAHYAATNAYTAWADNAAYYAACAAENKKSEINFQIDKIITALKKS